MNHSLCILTVPLVNPGECLTVTQQQDVTNSLYNRTTQGKWLPSPRSEAQALGWCCMCITFLQILLIISLPTGYRSQFSIPRAYFVYMVRHCTGQHCRSIYVCMYCLFASTWHPLVSVITTLYYDAIIFHHWVWYHVLSLCVFDKIIVRASSSSPRLRSCRTSFLSWPPLLS